MNEKRNYIGIVILSLVSLIITFPLFLSHNLILSQDILWHFVWSEQFQKALMEGVLYPRWVDTPFGYGSPTFIFYAPLTFYVISLINILTKSTILSMNIAIYLSFFLSGLSMYFFARKLNGERAGLISGVLYQLIPYHIFDLFSRGVVPELFAFIWFPLILLFEREIYAEKKSSSMAFMSFAYTGLIMTHLVSAFMFIFVMIGYGLYLSLFEKKRGLLRMLCAAASGIGLSSIYLSPVIFERSFTHIELIKIFNYRDNFLFLQKNLVKREFYMTVHGIAISEIAFLLLSLLLIRRKSANNETVSKDTYLNTLPSIPSPLRTQADSPRRKGRGNTPLHPSSALRRIGRGEQEGTYPLSASGRQEKSRVRRSGISYELLNNNIFFVALLFVSLFLATPLSSFIWRYVPEFSNLQFPWRWLTFSGLSVSLVAGNLIGNFAGEVRKSAIMLFAPFFVISVFLMLQISFFRDGDIERWRMHPNAFSPFEYRPVWLDDPRGILPAVEKVTVVKGTGSTSIIAWKSTRRVLSVNGKTPLTIKFSTFYYPGWTATVDGKENEVLIEKETGSMIIEVPQGQHKIILSFVDTPARRYGKIISIIALCSVVVLGLYGILSRRKRRTMR